MIRNVTDGYLKPAQQRELATVNLPKWPGLLCKGDEVTHEQANEIILRTTTFLMSNDKEWERIVADIMGAPPKRHHPSIHSPEREQKEWNAYCDEVAAWWDSLPTLKYSVVEGGDYTRPVNLLNNERIMCCWIGGPKGWCDWDGTIFTNNYNIGKWPSADDIVLECVALANAFPFLNAKFEVLNHEAGYGPGSVQYTGEIKESKVLLRVNIRDGQVSYDCVPSKPTMVDVNAISDATKLLSKSGYERGVSISRLKKAMKELREKFPDIGNYAAQPHNV